MVTMTMVTMVAAVPVSVPLRPGSAGQQEQGQGEQGHEDTLIHGEDPPEELAPSLPPGEPLGELASARSPGR